VVGGVDELDGVVGVGVDDVVGGVGDGELLLGVGGVVGC